MKRKRNGFTLVEVVITLTFTVIVLSIVGTFFGIGTRINANTFIKSELEDESKEIQNEILNFGMEAKCIEKVHLYDDSEKGIDKITIIDEITIDDKERKLIEVPYDELCKNDFFKYDHKLKLAINIKSLKGNEESIEGNNSISGYNSKLVYDKDSKTLMLNDSKLYENVESIEIKPADTRQSFKDCSTLNINITLSKRKAEVKESNIKVESNMVIVFRNKGMEEYLEDE